jgi:hypothetical protein
MRVIYYPFLHCGEGLRLDKIHAVRAENCQFKPTVPMKGTFVIRLLLMSQTSNSPLFTLRNIMSVSPRLLKLPKPMSRHSWPIAPKKAALVVRLLLVS